jgi:TM2 domain-containing membrane protein YozV
MKFIIPKNYNYHLKILGIIDYPTAIFNLLVLGLLWLLLSPLFPNILRKTAVVIILYLPLLLITIVESQNESPIYRIYYILKFFVKPRIYLYM